MPSLLVSAKIRGIRSYSPREDRDQIIEFMPLTLIVGSNGTGKTTIIESLKFIISGSEPPHSDSRRNFIHEPKDDKALGINNHEYACIELTFKNSSNQLCIARRLIARNLSKITTPATTSSYKVGSKPWVSVHRQDDWGKIIPQLFGLPNQAILNNVILCHQEENLWCMGDSIQVKQIFDKIFGCEQYKKEMKFIDDEMRTSKKEQQLIEKDLDHLREKVLRKDTVTKQINELETEYRRISAEALSITSELEILVEKKKKLSETLDESERRTRNIDRLKQRIRELTERDAIYRNSLKSFTIKRPAPAAPSANKQPPAKKKPPPDPTATDLESVIGDFNRMVSMIDSMPSSDDLKSLKALIEQTVRKVGAIKERFEIKANEPPPPSPPPKQDEEIENDAEIQVRKYREEIEANISKNLEELESINKNIESIQQQDNDESKLRGAREKLQGVESDLIKTREQRSLLMGSKIQIERELQRLKSELSSFSRVNILYAESLGKLVCNKIILEDLEKLKVCFQESIAAFHDQMIIKINDLLRRRWRLIYQGTDIDSIELVDEEITRGKDKKSYNYFMAMRKNGKRMKMKEKSSAGQRALAAIILRMTLAELFVRDFAFIALDEPTANLDTLNVQALAKSIGTYVRKRTKLGINIQWIIITHDEQFLRALDEECSPYFYRVKMDPTDKCSNIVKISCRESGFAPSDKLNGDD